jgi:hypothetical protein
MSRGVVKKAVHVVALAWGMVQKVQGCTHHRRGGRRWESMWYWIGAFVAWLIGAA